MDIFVFGRGGHAKVVSDIVAAQKGCSVAGYVDRAPGARRFLDREVFDEAGFAKSHRGAAVVLALGDNALRRKLHERHEDAFAFPALAHPSALLSPSVTLGEGSVVMPGALVNAGTAIGRFCVINTGAVVEHDCQIGDFASVAPRACLCGGCTLGEDATIGAGATVIQGLTLGAGSLVGAGALVCEDVAAKTLVAGVPARPR